MKKRLSVNDIRSRKNPETPLVCLTAYTAPMANILDSHADCLLVGDSLGMVLYDMENTLGVTLEIMVQHGKAVRRGAPEAFIIVDMPYGTYENNQEQALQSARRLLEETGCNAVKLEGGEDIATAISAIVNAGIPVMGHIGLQPQSVIKDGGYKIKGRSEPEEERLIRDIKAVEQAGAFSVVIEGTYADVSERLTRAVKISTIGIGASGACDGQVLVTDDLLNLSLGKKAKFVKTYADLPAAIHEAVSAFARDVRDRRFPEPEHVYTRADFSPAASPKKSHGA